MQSRCENYGSYCSLERLRIKQSLSSVLKPLPRLPRGVACPERRTGIGLWRGDDQPFVIQLGNPQKATNHQKDSESRPPDGFSVGPGGGRQLFHRASCKRYRVGGIFSRCGKIREVAGGLGLSWCGVGRPPHERAWRANAFVAKAVLGLTTTIGRVERLTTDRALRRICGFSLCKKLPSEATFSRAFDEFSKAQLAGRAHDALIQRTPRP